MKKNIEQHLINKLSHQLFEYTFKYNLTRKKISNETGVSMEDVLKLQSGNPFVSLQSFQKVEKYLHNIENNVFSTMDDGYLHQDNKDILIDDNPKGKEKI